MKPTQSQKDKKAAEKSWRKCSEKTFFVTVTLRDIYIFAFLAGVRYARRTRKKKK